MKGIIIFIITVISFVAISCGNAENSQTPNGSKVEQTKGTFKNVSVTDLNTAISENNKVIMLDVRTPGEVSQGYVENAINIDINNSDFKSKVTDLDKSKTVYVYCRSGHRSQTASKVLVDMGFSDVRNVEGGILAWSQKGYKTVK